MPAKPPPAPLPTPPSRTLGENLKQQRLARNLSQLSLAHAIGLNGDDAGAFISRLELGTQQPRLSTLRKLALALGCKVTELIS